VTRTVTVSLRADAVMIRRRAGAVTVQRFSRVGLDRGSDGPASWPESKSGIPVTSREAASKLIPSPPEIITARQPQAEIPDMAPPGPDRNQNCEPAWRASVRLRLPRRGRWGLGCFKLHRCRPSQSRTLVRNLKKIQGTVKMLVALQE
jgi:hypothetical protein